MNYSRLTHTTDVHLVQGWLKAAIGAVGIVALSATGFALIVATGRGAPAGIAQICILAGPSGLWVLRWWLLPWPSEIESLAWVVLMDVAIGIHNVMVQDAELGATGNACLVATGGYIAVFHGPRVLFAHAGWSLLTIGALSILVAFRGDFRSRDAGAVLAIGSASLAVVCFVLPIVQFCCWLFWHQALMDPLTGLTNRRGLDFHLIRYVGSQRGWPRWLVPCRQHRQQIYFATVDIDRFKAVNDAYGHPVGDEVLVQAARRLRAAVDSDALVARVGGDEFVIIGYVRGNGDSLGERLRKAIENTDDLPVAVTASIGVAFCDAGPTGAQGDAASCRHRLRVSDEAMYAAKRLGGNRAIVVA